MRSAAVVALAALASCVGVSARMPPTFGDSLYIKAVMKLPYAGIIEPIESYYDAKNKNLRVEYYGGADTYIFRTDLNATWQVNPTSMDGVASTQCFGTAGVPDVRPHVPDLTGFTLETDAVQVNQQICDSWVLSSNTLGKVSTYNFYVNRDTGAAVRYQMMGYDSLIGSHYDLYQLDYTNLTSVGAFPAGTFDQPARQCGSFPGPGVSHMNALEEMDGYFPGDIESDELISPEYADYLEAHGKIAAEDTKEVRLREMQFKKHSHFINTHQRKVRMGQASYSVALNFLADHLPAELAQRRGRLPTGMGGRQESNGAAAFHKRRFSNRALPQSIDWRTKGAVNPPQDQGICGSCWSFGSTAAIESAYFLKYGKLKVFAEQQLMDCSWGEGNNACDGGEDFRAYNYIMKNGGISFKENYGPYLMADGYCHAAGLQPDASINHYVNVTEFDTQALMDAIASQGPMSVSIDASQPGLSFYVSGVYNDPACKNGVADLDHSVSAVGYGTDPDGGDYWIVKNNWSNYWGDEGYIKIARSHDCGVATTPTYVVLN